VTCGTGFGFGLGFGAGVALACRAGVADGALDVPGLLLAAGAAAGVAVHAVARQATAPTTSINRMRDSIGTRRDGTVKGLAMAETGHRLCPVTANMSFDGCLAAPIVAQQQQQMTRLR
jgi:hypothetical protein